MIRPKVRPLRLGPRRFTGEFYTPVEFAAKGLEYLERTIGNNCDAFYAPAGGPRFVAAADGTKRVLPEIPSCRPWDKTPEMEAFAQFVASLEMRFAGRMRAFLKDELGVKALLTDMSSGMEREPFRAVRAALCLFLRGDLAVGRRIAEEAR
jgi:hypothetical protein